MKQSTEDREYSVIGHLSSDKSSLESGEVFIRISQWRVMRRLLGTFVESGKELDVNFKLFRYHRSLAQNRWLYGPCIGTIQAFLYETQGVKYDKAAIKAYIENKILGYAVKSVEISGKEVMYMEGKALKDMSTKEFAYAQQSIVDYYEPMGCYIPLSKGMNTITEHVEGLSDD